MKKLFEKLEYNTVYCSSWHIRKNSLEKTHFDNQLLQFYDYGFASCKRKGETPLNHSATSSHWSILFITGGSCIFQTRSGNIELKKNDFLVQPPNIKSNFIITRGNTLKVKKLLFEDTPPVRTLAAKFIQNPCLHTTNPEELEKLFERMEKILVTPSEMQLRDLSICIYSILAEAVRQLPDKESVLSMRSIVTEIACAPWNNYTLPELAKKCGLSTRSFQRKFKEQTQQSFLAYLTNCKLDLASRLLRNKHYSIKEVIKMCNFRSEPHFYKLFKSYTGIVPGMYRRNFREDDHLKSCLGNLESHAPEEMNLTGTRKKILAYIRGNKKISIAELAEALSLHRSAVQKNIQYLKNHGFLRRSGSTRAGSWLLLGRDYEKELKKQTEKTVKK